MGAGFSSPQLAGAVQTLPTTQAVPTSYAFNSGNTNSFGFAATFSADPRTDGFSPPDYVTSQSIALPLKAGGSTTVDCGPVTVSVGATGASVTCPIANTLIGVGTATYFYTADSDNVNAFPQSRAYLIAFTTLGNEKKVTTSTVTSYATPSIVTVSNCGNSWEALTSKVPGHLKNCRPAKQNENGHYRVMRRDISGYGPPDITFPGPGATATVTTTVTSPASKQGVKTVTITNCAASGTTTSAKTSVSTTKITTLKTTPSTTASTTTSADRRRIQET